MTELEAVAAAAPATTAASATKAAPAKRAAAKRAPAKRAAATKKPVSTTEAATMTHATPPAALAQGSSDWTSAELEALREDLEHQSARLEQELTTLQASIIEVLRDSGDGAGDDQADSGAKALEREQELTLIANVRETLFQIQHAQARIGQGTYGACESCAGPIGKLRLQAFPRATFCVPCKQQQERR